MIGCTVTGKSTVLTVLQYVYCQYRRSTYFKRSRSAVRCTPPMPEGSILLHTSAIIEGSIGSRYTASTVDLYR